MNPLIKRNAIATALLSFSLSSVAYHQPDEAYEDRLERDTYAEVLRVEPIRIRSERSIPREECVERPVTEQRKRVEGWSPAARTVTGGAIGAGIGNAIGRGGGRDTATVIGGLIGAAIGAQSAYDDTYVEDVTRYEIDCRTVYDRRSEERVAGYDVTYRYNGEVFTQRMNRDPGKRLPVRVSVTPLD